MALYTLFPRSSMAALLIGTMLSLVPQAAFAASKQQKAQGAALFAEKGCSHCHGPSGFGGSDSGPDLSNVRKQLKPAQIEHQIHDGGNNMPPFGSQLSQDEIASLVAYLHSKRKPPPGWVKPKHSSPAPVAPPKSDQD